MDQSQWKALNQMIAKQTSSGTSQKTSSSGAAQTQYKTVLAGNQQQQHIILSGNSTQATTSVVGRTAGQRVAQRQSVNGATRSQPTGAGDTEIVKSLLTGRQYGQSILRPDIVSRGGRQAARSGAQKAAGKQVSLLQTNYQQSQIQVDAGQTSSIQLDQNMLQQLVCSPEMMSAAPGPGEVMYVMAGNVTYQIVGPSHPGAEITAIPVASGISLDELATISAQQESLKPEQLAGYQLQAGDASSASMVLQDMLQTGLDGQQYLQTGLDGTIATTTDDGMQIVMMAGDGYGGGTESTAQFGRDGDGASTIKLGGQDFILQAGQTLPPELQEMVDKGLPIDWSKYEFVIEGGENGPETTDAATFMMAQASADQSEALRLQEMALMQEAGTGAEVDSFAAGADYVKTESNDEMSAHHSMGVQFVTAAPGEYDDGEFSYLASPTRDEDPSQASGEVEPRVIPYSGFLHSFLDFVQGKGTETLSSVANSTITGKPPMPKYVPPETGSGSKAKDDFQKKYKGTPMTIIYTDANDPTGGSYIVTKSVEDQVEKGKQSVGKRKRSQLDSEGEDGSLENAEKMYRLSEDDFDSKKLDDSNLIRGRGRGRGRSSSAGRPVVSDTDRHLGVLSLLDSTVPDSAVIHVTQSEPHCFQKGDFVIDRKDAYKLDSYPIWRIENGKLLQKFDPSFEDGILVHKSASVYSSWSGDIRDNFKPIMVEVISQTATTVGRKQDITVHVLDKYKTKAPDDSLEQNPLLQLFHIYVQMLLNHAVDSNYLLAVQEQKVEYYLTPMIQIDHLLIEAEQAVLSEISWNDDFRAELEAWSCYAVVGLRTDQISLCQATPGANIKGIMTVKFYGQTYDRNFLAVESETTIANAKEFVIGKATFDNLGIYHSLHHFKFLLFRKCREEVNYVKSTSSGKSYEEAVDECIQNRIWVQQLFLDLKGLLERYIIIKTEDEAMEGDTATAGTH